MPASETVMTWGHRPARTPPPPDADPPAPGEQVVIVAGRHAGSKGQLLEIMQVPTPSGLIALVAVVRRPRAGDTFVFPDEIRRAR